MFASCNNYLYFQLILATIVMSSTAPAEGSEPARQTTQETVAELMARGYTLQPPPTNNPTSSAPVTPQLGLPLDLDYTHAPLRRIKGLDKFNRSPADKTFTLLSYDGEPWSEIYSGHRAGYKGDDKALFETRFCSTVGIHVHSVVDFVETLLSMLQDGSISAADIRDELLQSLPALKVTITTVNNALIERVGLLRLRAVETDPLTREAASNKFLASINALPDVGAPGMNAVLSDLTLSMDSAKLKAAIKLAASKSLSSHNNGGGSRNNGDSSTRRPPRLGQGERYERKSNAHQTAKGGAAVGESSAARK